MDDSSISGTNSVAGSVKSRIRRRVHAARLAEGRPSPFADLFPPCPECAGSGRFCQDDGNVAELGPCPRCGGAGFVEAGGGPGEGEALHG